jgi:CMP-N-acetylneuraminic acid synthetase
MSVQAFVTIKLNSQRLPGKNLLELGGKPLCRHILETLQDVPGLDGISVFCSDETIAEHLPPGVRLVLRDPALDRDEVRGRELFQAFATAVPADYYVLAHTTAPFTRAATVSKLTSAVLDGPHDTAFAGRRLQTYAWHRGSPINYDPADMVRTQDLSPVVVENSSVYVYPRDLMMRTGRRIGEDPFILDVDFPEAIDIDTASDFDMAKRFEDLL